MDFEFDDHQSELRDAAAAVLAKECPATYLRAVIDGEHEPDDLWTTMGGLDWTGLAIAADDGGTGATEMELAIVLEQLGYVADPTPFLATTSQFAPFVAAFGDAEQRHRFLAPVAAGASVGALAGVGAGLGPAPAAITAEQNGDEWVLSGTAAPVLDADRAGELAVLARADAHDLAFVVPADSVTTRRTPAIDPTLHVAEVDVTGVRVSDDRRLAVEPGTAAVELVVDHALVGLATTMVGACQRALDMVVAYVGERHQFDVPIGSFQAVKHQIVDMHVAVERARALAYFAALTIAEDDDRRRVAASMAKAAAGDAQHQVFQHAIQLFGGIGFTWENDLHLYLRRAKVGELLFGGAVGHRTEVGRLVMAERTGKT